MAIYAFCGGRLEAKPQVNVFKRFFFGLAKEFNKMSVAGALRSKQAEEFKLPCPAGEDNWKSRMTFASTLADAIERSPSDVPAGFSTILEPFYNNLFDCAISERTTLSNAACRLIGTLPKVLGKDIHPHLDRLLPVLIRQCASTKAVAQKSASAAITNVINFSPYNGRLLWHVCQTMEDKYSAPKLYAPGWLKLIIENYHPALNPDRDYEMISRAIATGLVEADNNVRVNSRATFWEYHKMDPTGAENIMNNTLHSAARTALLNDPNNPDKPQAGGKKQSESAAALAQIRQAAKERLKQKTRVANAKPITSEDFTFGDPDIPEIKHHVAHHNPVHHSTVHHTTTHHRNPLIAPPVSDVQLHVTKNTSRPIAIHKKGSSQDAQVAPLNKKTSTMDITSAHPKKPISTDGLRTSQNKKPTSAAAEASNARPLLSAPVRRPRIVATPINGPQTSSRPTSRAGVAPTIPAVEPVLRAVASNKEFKSNTAEAPIFSGKESVPSKPTNKLHRSDMSSPVFIPHGKENANVYIPRTRPDRTSPVRITTPVDRNAGPIHPPKVVPIPDDGLNKAQRFHQQAMEKEMREMAPLMPQMAFEFGKQDEEKSTQMYHVYPALNDDGQVEHARRSLAKAIEYLKKDSLDQMGMRKLRKLLETYGRNLIIDRTLYDTLFSELIPRMGSFEELLVQPIEEVQHESHPRYIRQAVLSMINVLVRDYPFEWSFQYQGPALASLLIARCTYSANCTAHEGAPYVQNLTIVNNICASIQIIVESCCNPVSVLDSLLQVLAASEDYLMRCAPHDSESDQPASWASYNPYSNINRLRSDVSGIFHPKPMNLDTFDLLEPSPLPIKLPLLMETGLKIIQALIIKASQDEFPLGEERENILADLARHLMSSYSIIIRREVMIFCRILYQNVDSERFWSHFQDDSERNLLHYYLEK